MYGGTRAEYVLPAACHMSHVLRLCAALPSLHCVTACGLDCRVRGTNLSPKERGEVRASQALSKPDEGDVCQSGSHKDERPAWMCETLFTHVL